MGCGLVDLVACPRSWMVQAGGSIRKGKDANLRVKKQNNKTLRLFTVPTFLNVTCNLIY